MPRHLGDDDTGGVWMSWFLPSPAEVDAVHELALQQGITVTWPPTDEPWGVRECHLGAKGKEQGARSKERRAKSEAWLRPAPVASSPFALRPLLFALSSSPLAPLPLVVAADNGERHVVNGRGSGSEILNCA